MADELPIELRIRHMEADIENKNADTQYKQGLLRYEPWKIVFVAFGTGAGLMGAIVGLLALILKH